MFKFFTQKKWQLWAWLGSFVILSLLWVQVKIDVEINEWFGQFYDMIQKALAAPNAITIDEYWSSLASFITLAGMYIALYVLISFFTISAAKLNSFEFTLPDGISVEYEPELMQQIDFFVRHKASHMIFIYGEYDAWSATAVELNDSASKRELYKFVLPKGGHKTRIKSFNDNSKNQIYKIIDSWLNLENETLIH